MPAKCSLFIDAGYLLASAAYRLTGTSLRSGIHVKYGALVKGLIKQAEDATGLQVLRVHWYDSAKDGVPDRSQERIGELPKVKLRLGRFGYDGQQKGVDLRLGLDMVTHARNHAAEVFLLVSGDDDLTEAVEDVQIHGVSVVILAVPSSDGQPHGVSRHLVRAADEIITVAPKIIDNAVIPIETPEYLGDEGSEEEMPRMTEAGFVLTLPGGNSAILPVGGLGGAGLTSPALGTGSGADNNISEPHIILPSEIHAGDIFASDIHTAEINTPPAPNKSTGDNIGAEAPQSVEPKEIDLTAITASVGAVLLGTEKTEPVLEVQGLGSAFGAMAEAARPEEPASSATLSPATLNPASLSAGIDAVAPEPSASPAPTVPGDTADSEPASAAPQAIEAEPLLLQTETAEVAERAAPEPQEPSEPAKPPARPNPGAVAATLSRLVASPTPRPMAPAALTRPSPARPMRPTYSVGPDKPKSSGTWAHQWEDSMEQVVQRVLQSLVKSTTAKNWEIIKLGRPSIPQEIDKALLLDATEAMGVYTLSDAERHEVRAAFWREFDKLER